MLKASTQHGWVNDFSAQRSMSTQHADYLLLSVAVPLHFMLLVLPSA
jgi:hypothetical protein